MFAQLAQASKQLRVTVTAAHSLWQSECIRIGWATPQQSVAPLITADLGPTWFNYFCVRMLIRHEVRCRLDQLCAEFECPFAVKP